MLIPWRVSCFSTEKNMASTIVEILPFRLGGWGEHRWWKIACHIKCLIWVPPREASDKGGLVQGLKLIDKLSVLEIKNEHMIYIYILIYKCIFSTIQFCFFLLGFHGKKLMSQALRLKRSKLYPISRHACEFHVNWILSPRVSSSHSHYIGLI